MPTVGADQVVRGVVPCVQARAVEHVAAGSNAGAFLGFAQRLLERLIQVKRLAVDDFYLRPFFRPNVAEHSLHPTAGCRITDFGLLLRADKPDRLLGRAALDNPGDWLKREQQSAATTIGLVRHPDRGVLIEVLSLERNDFLACVQGYLHVLQHGQSGRIGDDFRQARQDGFEVGHPDFDFNFHVFFAFQKNPARPTSRARLAGLGFVPGLAWEEVRSPDGFGPGRTVGGGWCEQR